eukprot:1334549-Karenia_brevis.AAC.1
MSVHTKTGSTPFALFKADVSDHTPCSFNLSAKQKQGGAVKPIPSWVTKSGLCRSILRAVSYTHLRAHETLSDL